MTGSFFYNWTRIVAALTLLFGLSQAYAAAVLEIKPITWNIVGLKSNNVNQGPNEFPVGARVCNTGDAPATNVTTQFFWDGSNAFINLTGNTTLVTDTLPFGVGFHDLGPTGPLPGHCAEFYWNLVVTRNAAAYDTSRPYHIEATADGLGTVSTPPNREIYVEHLVSQNRNATTSITGPSVVYVGGIYQFTVTGYTAVQGYQQLVFFLNFPNILFRILSVDTQYAVPAAPNNTNNGVYADACGWDPDIGPLPPTGTYRSCAGGGDYPANAGGNPISTTYTIEVLSAGSADLTTLIYDFSGSSFHYNSDYGGLIHPVVAVEASDLELTKSVALTNDVNGSGTINAGDTVTFTVSVTNNGPTDATNVVVEDQLPDGFTFGNAVPSAGSYLAPNWDLGSLANGATATLEIVATVNASGNYENIAQVASVDQSDPDSTPGNDDPTEDDQDHALVVLDSPTADLRVIKTFSLTSDADGSGSVTPGDTVTFLVQVENPGPSSTTNVSVNDQLPNGFALVSTDPSQGGYAAPVWTVGTLGVGATATLTMVATVNASATGDYTNVAEITGSDQPDPDPTDNQDQVTVPVAEVADLSLSKSVSLTIDADASGGITPGDRVTFTVTVANSGPDTATNVSVADQLPPGYTFVSAAASQGGYAAPIWSVGGLASGANATLDIVATVNLSGDYTNVAQVASSDQFDPDSTPGNSDPAEDDQAHVVVVPGPATADLHLVKEFSLTSDIDGSGSVTPGDTVTFLVTVSNQGPFAATNVSVNEQLPSGFTLVNATASPGSSYVAPVWTVGTLDVGGSATLAMIAAVNATGDYTNVAEIVASDQQDPDSTPNNHVLIEDDQDEVAVPVAEVADLSLAKSVSLTNDADNSGTITSGDTVTFTVSVHNSGPNTATNVFVEDQLPSGYNLVSETHSQGTYGAPTWALGSLANGANATLNMVATVNLAGDHTNVAQVSASDQFDPDSTPGNNVDTEDDWDHALVVLGLATADLRVIKTFSLTSDADGSGSVTPGDTVTFLVQVENPGPSSATNVSVNDQLPTGFALVSANPSQGGYAAPVWTVGTLGVGGTATLTMVATVNASGDYTNAAEITGSDQPDPDPTDNTDQVTVPVAEVADLSLAKSVNLTIDADNSGDITPGDTVTFTVSVANSGPNTATNVTVTDQLPSGYNWVSANPSPGSYLAPTWTLGSLASGANATLTMVATVNLAGDYINVAQIAASDQFDPDSTPGNSIPTEDDQNTAEAVPYWGAAANPVPTLSEWMLLLLALLLGLMAWKAYRQPARVK